MLEYLLSQDKSVGLELLERLLPLLHESQRPMKLGQGRIEEAAGREA